MASLGSLELRVAAVERQIESFFSPRIELAPVNTGLPAINGLAAVGQVLSASTGVWTNNPSSYLFQWAAGGIAIAGATIATYPLSVAELGEAITVSVIAQYSGGLSSQATSIATAAVTV